MIKANVLKVCQIGNSRGIRLSSQILRKYGILDSVIAEERDNEIALRSSRNGPAKLTWEETYRAMAAADEDWSDWDNDESRGAASAPYPNLSS